MFLYKYSSHGDDVDGPVKINCKTFCKNSVEMVTVYTLEYKTFDEFSRDMTTDKRDMVFPRSRFTPIKNALWMCSTGTDNDDDEHKPKKRRGSVVNRTLITSKTAQFTALTRSFVACASDPAKWYILTALRTVVGGSDGPMGMTFPTIRAIVDDYHKTVSKTTSATASDGCTIFEVYDEVICAGPFWYIAQTSEYREAAKIVFGRLSDTYVKFNGAVDVVTGSTQTFANLVFDEMLNERFESTVDVIEEDGHDKEDAKQLIEYESRLNSINNSGSEHIRRHLEQTCALVPYDPKAHQGYVFEPSKRDDVRKATGTTDNITCSAMCSKIVPRDLFPNSMAKAIRVSGVGSLSKLCNASMFLCLTKTPVKTILAENGVRTNVPFMGVVKPVTERAMIEG
ncbi:hypothetical protein ElyMa_004523800 [Elysia marginata]|uniref:Uncharacterized protein n=1 Tax=Elysia marginata TaxID=1093978 RepID=A0AAV4HQ01_9GAST|nr:hypothetical protein ElyMa_004523800 [Elysia marginata]